MTKSLLVTLGATGFLVTGCGSSGDGSSSVSSGATSPSKEAGTAAKPTPTAKPPPKPGETVQVGSTDHGKILVDAKNRPLYLFTLDGKGPSKCSGGCAAAWPPFLTKGTPQAGKGAKASLVGTTKRSDGAVQVTYKGQPLYYYVSDSPGVVRCQNVVEFGGTWLIVNGSGAAIRS